MNQRLGREPIGKLLIEFSIPAIIGSLIVMLYSVIDRIFIGQKLGAMALAGVTLTFPFSQIAVSLGGLIGIGGSTLVAIKLGENKKEECARITGNQISLFLIVCTFITIIQETFLVEILSLMGGEGETLAYAVSYGRIFIPVIFFQCFTYGLNGVVRAQGFPKYAMITSAIGAILNILLDYIFLFPLNMGVFGAGLATFISSGIAAAFNLRFFLSGRYPLTIRLPHLKLRKNTVLSIVKLGASAGLIQFSNAVVMGMYNSQLNRFSGSDAIAAYGIFMTVHSLIIMVVMGIAQGGMQPIIGYNLGSQNYSRVREAIKLTLIYGVLLSVFLMVIVQLFPIPILKIFVDEPSTIDIGVIAMRFGFSVVPLMICSIIISGVYQALGEAKTAFIFNFLRKIVIIIPAVVILPRVMGINGIWFSRPLSDTAACFIMLTYLQKTMKELKLKEEI